MIRALVEELKPLARNPGDFLTKLNGDLCAILRHTGTPLLTTAFYLAADWKSGVMLYANAGHPKPLHVRRQAGQVLQVLNASGKSQPALGLMEDARYQSSEILLSPDDLLLLYTDGLIEVQSPTSDLYTQQLLQGAVQRLLRDPAPKLFDALLEEVRLFSGGAPFSDDVCLVGMELAPQP
jgi:sigma-B regulation protein RsbU (phosphoserine phosphatase)